MKMFMRIQPVALVLTAAAVAGCGDSNGPYVPEAVQLPSYEKLGSTAKDASILGGVAIRSNSETEEQDVTEVEGTLQHSTGAATAYDGTFALNDSDGPDDGLNDAPTFKDVEDGTASITTDNTDKFEEEYEYVVAYTQKYTSDDTEFESDGFIGIVTSSLDMPTAGTATYEGEAIGRITTDDYDIKLASGTSRVVANFGAATVNVTMEGFTATDYNTDVAEASPPIDTISVADMDIVGNAFRNGTVAVMLDDVDVTDNVIGADRTDAASGAFFGYDHENSVPDEAAGVALSEGNTGKVRAEFIAD